jgi:hypothetical protein
LLSPCLDCPTLTTTPRCPRHTHATTTRRQAAKTLARPYLHHPAQVARRRAQVHAQPWCWRCGTTSDLTAGHVVPYATALAQGASAWDAEDGPLVTECRRCNAGLDLLAEADGAAQA